MPVILIAVGANLPACSGTPALQTCIHAVNALQSVAQLHHLKLSDWYETAPVPPSGQPPYVNGVARFEGSPDPVELLQALQAIETAYGRQRSAPNAARTLDLDIISIGGLVRTTPDLVLPHPRMHERGFVLVPLLDVAPDWRHPVSGLTARALLEALPPQQVRLLAPSHLRDGAATPN